MMTLTVRAIADETVRNRTARLEAVPTVVLNYTKSKGKYNCIKANDCLKGHSSCRSPSRIPNFLPF